MKTAHFHSQRKVNHEKSPQQSIQLKPCSLPAHGEFFPAVVSSVSVVGHVWIQPISDSVTAPDDLTNEMMETYTNMEHKLTNPSTGCYCAGKVTFLVIIVNYHLS